MFTGELGFETAFTSATCLANEPMYNFWIIVLYAGFILEMCIILMNLVIITLLDESLLIFNLCEF